MGDLFASSGHFPCSLEFIALLERDYFISRVDDLIDYKNLQFARNTLKRYPRVQVNVRFLLTFLLL